jgi:hypothetical protein
MSWMKLLLICAALPAAALATPTVSVEVLPRIGLFHELQYQREPTDRPALVKGQPNWQPMNTAAFLKAVHERTRSEILKATGGHWELLTTDSPQTGYGKRRARVVATGTRTPTACRVEVPAAGGAPARMFTGRVEGGACITLIELASNMATPVRVWADAGAPAVQPAEPVTVRVPEDFLIVVMGDSYASGEGTPDRPCNEQKSGWFSWGCDQGDALWMDQQCHRSFWSAGMQAALTLMGRERKQRGFTVLNVACSGASVQNGMLGSYEGVVGVATIVANHGAALGVQGLGNTGFVVLPQAEVVRDVLAAEAARGGKPAADLVVLSAGGNDIQFGQVVIDAVLRDQPEVWIADVENNLNRRLGVYTGQLPSLASALAAIPSELTLWVPYPDVTDIRDPRKLDATCASGATQFALFNDKSEKLLSISTAERALAYRMLVDKLNAINLGFTGGQRIHLLNREAIDDLYRYRGWCGSADNKAVFATGGRLIRKAEESYAYQRNLNGTMHPTAEAHDHFAKMILDVLARARQEEVDIELASLVRTGGAAPWTRSPVQVGFSPAARAFAGAPAHEICGTLSDPASCRVGSYEVAVPHGQRVQQPLVAVHGATKRKFRRHLPDHVVDNMAPQHLGCELQRGAASDRVSCDSGWVLGNDTLHFSARDEGSGLGTLTVAHKTAGGEFTLRALARPDGASVRAADLPSGVLELVVTAVDKVGLDNRQTYRLRVDRQPPAIPRVGVHGVDLVQSQFNRVLPARGGVLELTVLAADADSGVTALEAKVGANPITLTGHDELLRRQDACRDASLAGPPYARTLRVETAGTVPVTLVAYDCGRQPSAAVTLQVILVPGRPDDKAQAPSYWAVQGRQTAALRQLVGRMTSLFTAAPADTDSEAFGIYALWLNIADGRADPARVLPVLIQPGTCDVKTGAGAASSLYAALITAETCAAQKFGTSPDERNQMFDAILQAVATTEG